MLGDGLADRIGASALLYAALAYFVFDESYFLEDLSENYPELTDELMWWLEDFYSNYYQMIEDLRTLYETSIGPTERSGYIRQRNYRLLIVTYSRSDDSVFIGASTDDGDSKYGSEWNVPLERGNRTSSYGDELRRTFCLSGRGGCGTSV